VLNDCIAKSAAIPTVCEAVKGRFFGCDNAFGVATVLPLRHIAAFMETIAQFR
jgi:hypothetical protein